MTKKHMQSHGLTPEQYRAKWGMEKRAPLACKSIQRMRSEKMKDMKLWEKRGMDIRQSPKTEEAVA